MVTRYSADRAYDSDFGTVAIDLGGNEFVKGLAVDSQGRILIVGTSTNAIIENALLRAKTFWILVYENSTISPADARSSCDPLNVLVGRYFAVRFV